MNEQFQFYMPTKVLFKSGMVNELDAHLKGENVLVICDPFLYKSGAAQKIGAGLKGKNVIYCSDIEPNPSCESVDAAAAIARRKKTNCVIGLGGGSSLDVAKIVACLTTNEGSIYDYYSGGSRTFSSCRAELVCIPTTAGTGSEVTNVGVFTNKATHVKMPMVNRQFWPDIAVIDPALTCTLPPAITASTGMDAFCHAIEAYWNLEAQPMCDMLAMGALRLILDNVRLAYEEPQNKQARGAMLTASLTAGVAFSQTRTTGIHAASFPLTAEFGASHGVACSVTLPAFIRISGEKAGEKMRVLAAYLGCASIEALANRVEALMLAMKMPIRLSALGVKEADLRRLAKTALTAGIIQLTPATMNEQTVYALLKSIL